MCWNRIVATYPHSLFPSIVGILDPDRDHPDKTFSPITSLTVADLSYLEDNFSLLYCSKNASSQLKANGSCILQK